MDGSSLGSSSKRLPSWLFEPMAIAVSLEPDVVVLELGCTDAVSEPLAFNLGDSTNGNSVDSATASKRLFLVPIAQQMEAGLGNKG